MLFSRDQLDAIPEDYLTAEATETPAHALNFTSVREPAAPRYVEDWRATCRDINKLMHSPLLLRRNDLAPHTVIGREAYILRLRPAHGGADVRIDWMARVEVAEWLCAEADREAVAARRVELGEQKRDDANSRTSP